MRPKQYVLWSHFKNDQQTSNCIYQRLERLKQTQNLYLVTSAGKNTDCRTQILSKYNFDCKESKLFFLSFQKLNIQSGRITMLTYTVEHMNLLIFDHQNKPHWNFNTHFYTDQTSQVASLPLKIMTATLSAFILFLCYLSTYCCTRSSWDVLDIEKAQGVLPSKRQHWCQADPCEKATADISWNSPCSTNDVTGEEHRTGNNDGACFIVNGEQSSVWQQTKGQRTTILHEGFDGKADPEFWWRWRKTYWYIGQDILSGHFKTGLLGDTFWRGPHTCPLLASIAFGTKVRGDGRSPGRRSNFKLQGFSRAAGGDRSENSGSDLASQCQQSLWYSSHVF